MNRIERQMDYWDATKMHMFKDETSSDASSLKKCQKSFNFFYFSVPLGETSIDFYESLPAVLAPPTTCGKKTLDF